MTQKEKLNTIIKHVNVWRKKLGITTDKLSRGYLPEPSCEAFGEYHNLFFFQLVKTATDCGGWQELKRPEILNGVYQFVTIGVQGF